MKTEEIEARIRRTKRLDMNMIADNPPPEFSIYLQELLKEKSVKRSTLIRALNVDRNYGYQMMNGTRTPTRVQILHIAVYCKFDTKQTQRLLNLAGREALYVRRPRTPKRCTALSTRWSTNRRASSSGGSSGLGSGPLAASCKSGVTEGLPEFWICVVFPRSAAVCGFR
jgi:hypothetical protein